MTPTIKTGELFDWATVEAGFQKLLAEDLTPERVPEWLLAWSKLNDIVGEAYAKVSRAKDENTADEVAEKAFLDMIDHVEPRHQEITQQLTDKLLAIPYLPPPELEQMFKRLKVDKEIFHPNNIALWQDIFKLASGYSKLNGSVTVNLEGKTMTMAEARTRLLDPDRNLRKNAWKAMQQTSLKIAEEADTIFLQLIPLRQHLAKNIKLDNYRSYIWKGLKRFDYTPQDALDFIRSIEHEVIPILSKSQKVDKS